MIQEKQSEVKDWSTYLSKQYPRDLYRLERWSLGFTVNLPLSAYDPFREKIFRERLSYDIKEADERISRKNIFQNYVDTFKSRFWNVIRIVTYPEVIAGVLNLYGLLRNTEMDMPSQIAISLLASGVVGES